MTCVAKRIVKPAFGIVPSALAKVAAVLAQHLEGQTARWSSLENAEPPGKTQSFATGASISVSAAVVHRTDLLSRSLGQFVRSRQKPLQAQTSQQNVGRNGKRIVTTV
jgi:hypothetical protein